MWFPLDAVTRIFVSSSYCNERNGWPFLSGVVLQLHYLPVRINNVQLGFGQYLSSISFCVITWCSFSENGSWSEEKTISDSAQKNNTFSLSLSLSLSLFFFFLSFFLWKLSRHTQHCGHTCLSCVHVWWKAVDIRCLRRARKEEDTVLECRKSTTWVLRFTFTLSRWQIASWDYGLHEHGKAPSVHKASKNTGCKIVIFGVVELCSSLMKDFMWGRIQRSRSQHFQPVPAEQQHSTGTTVKTVPKMLNFYPEEAAWASGENPLAVCRWEGERFSFGWNVTTNERECFTRWPTDLSFKHVLEQTPKMLGIHAKTQFFFWDSKMPLLAKWTWNTNILVETILPWPHRNQTKMFKSNVLVTFLNHILQSRNRKLKIWKGSSFSCIAPHLYCSASCYLTMKKWKAHKFPDLAICLKPVERWFLGQMGGHLNFRVIRSTQVNKQPPLIWQQHNTKSLWNFVVETVKKKGPPPPGSPAHHQVKVNGKITCGRLSEAELPRLSRCQCRLTTFPFWFSSIFQTPYTAETK